jgi:uncharacterized protein (TIGR02246 family)
MIHGPTTITRALGAAALLLGSTAGCAPTAAPTAAPERCAGEPDEGAVRAVLDSQRAAWNAGDLDGFLAGYEQSDALLFTSGGKIRQGFAETRDKYRARYGDTRETMGTLGFEILDIRSLGACADAAIVLGRWSLSDKADPAAGVFTVVLERRAGAWRIVHDHTSVDAP